MAKRTKLSKTVRKVSTLPSIDDEDDFTCSKYLFMLVKKLNCESFQQCLDEFLSNSIGKESFISSSTSLSPGEEDEDDELPVVSNSKCIYEIHFYKLIFFIGKKIFYYYSFTTTYGFDVK